MKKTIFLISLVFTVLLIGLATPIYAMNKAVLVEAIASGVISAQGTGNLYEGAGIITNSAGLSKADAKRALDAFVGTTTKSLKRGNRVALVGFGSFSVSKRSVGAGQVTEILKEIIKDGSNGKFISKRKARTGRNPQTGATIQIPAKKVVRFKAGADLAKTVA